MRTEILVSGRKYCNWTPPGTISHDVSVFVESVYGVFDVLRVTTLADRFSRSKGLRFALVASTALFVILSIFQVAFAGNESHFYDAQGRYQGRSTTNTANQQQKSLYDAQGRYVGRVMTDGNGNSRVYDQHGNYRGRATGRTNVKSNN